MDKNLTVTPSEWPIMELLWEGPKTLMDLVNTLSLQTGWSKSTVTTMVRRMDDKGLITFHTEGRTKIFRPTLSREEITVRDAESLLRRAYNGSVGMLVSAMANANRLTKQDIAELYAIIKEAEEELQ